MSLEILYDLPDVGGNESSPSGGIAYNGYLYICTIQPRYTKINLADGSLVWTQTTVNSAPHSMAIGDVLTGVIGSSANSQFDFIELSSGYRKAVTTNAAALLNANVAQQITANPSTGFGLATRTGTGSLTLLTFPNQTVSVLTPTGFTGVQLTCVCNKDGNFLVGTNNGKIFEVTTGGTVVNTVTLPATPVTTGTQTGVVRGISYFNDLVLVATDRGLLHLYKWSTSTLMDTQLVPNSTVYMTESVSGLCYITPSASMNTPGAGLIEVFFGNSSIEFENTSYITDCATSTGPKFISYDTVTKRLCGVVTLSAFKKIKVWKATGLENTSVTARFQDPVNTDVAARIIRYRNPGIGRLNVESDVNIPAAETSLPARQGVRYLEEGEYTTKVDYREFDS